MLAASLGAVAAAAVGCGGDGGRLPQAAASRSPRSSSPPTGNGSSGAPNTPAATHRPPLAAADPAAVAGRATVPVLCWHQLRDWTGGDSSYSRRLLICPPATFREQLEALASHGYTTISADQYLEHLSAAAPLPARPVMLTFDDAQRSQIDVGLPELVRREMTATFFIMTVVLDRPRWMRRTDLRRLAETGMTVAAHSWDHHRADRYSGRDWQVQLVQPRAELERIVGKPVRHFAYPHGAWSRTDFPHLANAGYVSAYQLSDREPDPVQPLYTLRRVLVDSTWTGRQVIEHLD